MGHADTNTDIVNLLPGLKHAADRVACVGGAVVAVKVVVFKPSGSTGPKASAPGGQRRERSTGEAAGNLHH